MAGMTIADRNRAIGRFQSGESLWQIARLCGCHVSTISRLLQKFRQTGRVDDQAKQPRRRVTTPQQDRQTVTDHQQNRFEMAASTARRTRGRHGRPVSNLTVLRRLRSQDIRAYHPFGGLVITPRHRQNRLLWGRQHTDDSR